MSLFSTFVCIYLLAINIGAMVVCCYDKWCAARHKRRISERALLNVSALGGALGMYLTMLCVRHKTKHRIFMIGVPLMLIVHVVLLYLCTVN